MDSFIVFAALFCGTAVMTHEGSDIYIKTTASGTWTFPYDANKVCKIIRGPRDFYFVNIEDVYSLQKSYPEPWQIASSNTTVINCFNYNGYSHLFFQVADKIHVVRGRSEKTFKFPIVFKGLYYDHLLSHLYILGENGTLYNFDMYSFSKFWTVKNFVKTLLETRHSVAMSQFYSPANIVFNLTETYDLMVYNNSVYSLERGHVYKTDLDTFNKTSTDYGMIYRKFEYILFPTYENLIRHLQQNPNIVYMSHNSPIILNLPPPPSNLSDSFFYILYIEFIAFVLFCFYKLRHMLAQKGGLFLRRIGHPFHPIPEPQFLRGVPGQVKNMSEVKAINLENVFVPEHELANNLPEVIKCAKTHKMGGKF
jgi:hypothetical protein